MYGDDVESLALVVLVVLDEGDDFVVVDVAIEWGDVQQKLSVNDDTLWSKKEKVSVRVDISININAMVLKYSNSRYSRGGVLSRRH